MKKYAAFLVYLHGMVFLLPFVITVLFSGTGVFGEYVSLEDRLLSLVLAQEIPWNAPAEVLKAQAVLVRTNDIVAREEGKSLKERFAGILAMESDPQDYSHLLMNYPKYRAAMEDTSEVLTYKEKPCLVPYHQSNNGLTRDGQEVLHEKSYSYLVSVDSSQDRQASSYGKSIFFPGDFEDNITILSRDSAGYVMEAMVGEELISGEELRGLLHLPSSAFSVQEVEGKLRVFCKGAGHGLGLSQYGASVLAAEGQSYIEILNYYFPQMTLESKTVKNLNSLVDSGNHNSTGN